jgi:hypothetical protein
MHIRTCLFLFYCLLMAAAGCASKSEVVQQSTSTQQAPSPQQPAPGATSNTQSNQQQNLNAAGGPANTKTDACSLLTSSEIEAVQGEAVRETKSSDRSNGSFAISQCFYSLPTYNKSVSLQVTRGNNAQAKPDEAREFWNHTFHKEEKEGEEAGRKRDKGEEAEQERREKKEEAEKERRGGRGEEGEEEEGAPPKPVPGVGDEAFWAGGRVAGALYVLKGNAFIRISIGGPGDESAKIEKLKALAQKVMARL